MKDRPRAILWGLLLLLGALLSIWIWRRSSPPPKSGDFLTNALSMLVEYEQQQAERYWAPELQAEKFGRVIEQLWDKINASTNKLAVLADWPFDLKLPQFANALQLSRPHGIRVINPSGGSWPEILARASSEGWKLEQCEFRHNAFFTNQAGHGVASTYYVSGHLSNPREEKRAIVEGNVKIWWNERPDLPPVREVDAREVQIRLRDGPPPFRRVVNDIVTPPAGSYFIDPILVWDLDGDGTSEIILAAKNAVYRRATNGQWQVSPLLKSDPGLIFTAILGDFTGNGTVDFLCAKFEGLFLYEGDGKGGFAGTPVQVWNAQPHLKYAQALSAGDADGDGDLDIYLGQYKLPYDKGQMPFPYFDANDGFPSYYLVNDGAGHFTDRTVLAGLGTKRARRVYSASWIDLDGDADLDLVLVSDFAGLDAFANDGHGHFHDATREWFSETWGFGMAHAFADFNADGALDLLMVAMNSPTADRLASLRLTRPYDVSDATMRSRLTYGNRLFFGQPDGTFHQSPVSDQVARTGWSWGAVAEDFDNDGYSDLYIANGHETHASVQDYEPEFWLHDIHVGNSRENALAYTYFQEKSARTRGRGQSYGGYEKNRFFLNLGGTNFVEAAWLFGVALEQDSRNVVAEDLDGDGKLDLIVTTFEAWPEPRQTFQIYENHFEQTGHWLLVRFPPRPEFYGARVTSPGRGAWALATGDGYRIQRPLRIHAGLGAATNSPTMIVQPIGKPAVNLRSKGVDHRIEAVE